MHSNPTRLHAALVVGAVALLSACGPRVLETRLVTDTNDTGGGHQVVALIRAAGGVGRAELQVAAAPNGDALLAEALLDRAVLVLMQPVHNAPVAAAGEAWLGNLGSFPVGTRVYWRITACGRVGACVEEPAAPAWASFVVGRVPSSPAVTGVRPGRGPTSGGVRVEVTGKDFREGVELLFDGVPCAHVEVLQPTLAACVLPPGEEGPSDVTARNPDGEAATLRDGFVYYQAPRVVAVIPNRGPTAGGQDVRLEGAFFPDGARVTFAGRHARFVTVVSAQVITCQTPPGNPGFVDVAVQHPEGGEGVLPRGYRYVPPPVVDGVIPPEGPDFGGQQVTVTGDNFETGATVTVGGLPCVDVLVEDAQTLTCTVPAGTPGAADVTVVNPDGQQGSLSGGYYYNGPPQVLGVDPPDGPIAPGAEADVLGAGFLPGMTVRFGGVTAQVLLEGSRDRVRVVVPAAAPPVMPAPQDGERVVAVAVENPLPDGRMDALEDAYTYLWPPEPQLCLPDRGPTSGGTRVSVRGRFFRSIRGEPITVTFNQSPATDVTVVDAQEILVTTPMGMPGFADVAVQNHPLSSGVGNDIYLYIPPPDPDRVIPPDGPTFGGEVITIEGRFFQPGATVTLDGAPCTNVMVNMEGTALTCTTPPGERGPADVVVTNPDGQSGSLPAGYTYVAVAVTPNGGFEVGFTRVRIRAAGMQEGVQVLFGDTPATDITRVSSREVVVQSPARGLGRVDVRFRNPDGTTDVAENAFEYRTLVDRSTGGVMPLEFDTGNDGEAADVDGDGDVDVVVANGGVDTPEVSTVYRNQLRETGSVSFRRTGFSGVFTANQVSMGDINGDGAADLLLASSQGSHLYTNDGRGNFNEVMMPNSGDGAFEGVIADLTADNIPDIFLLNIGCSEGGGPNCNPDVTGRDTFLQNLGMGALQDVSSRVPHDEALVHDHKLELWDLDGNGRKDLIIVSDNKNFRGRSPQDVPRHRVLLNFANGFEERDPPDLRNLIGDVYGIAMGDLDGDGRGDLVLPNYLPQSLGALNMPGTPGSTVVLMGQPGVDFVRDDTRLGVGLLDEPTISTVVVDLDEDGDLEILSANLQGINRLFVNRGNGFFVPAVSGVPQINQATTDLVAGDYDDDGDLDVLVVNQGQDILLLAQPMR